MGSIRFVSEQSCSTIFLFLSQPSSFLHSVLCLLRALLFPFFPGGVFICSLFFMLLLHFCFGVPLAPLNASRVPLSVYGAQPPFPTASRTFSPQSVGGGGGGRNHTPFAAFWPFPSVSAFRAFKDPRCFYSFSSLNLAFVKDESTRWILSFRA